MESQNVFYSVIITSYKRDKAVVHRAINSIFNQTCSYFEILLVDDNPNGNDYSIALEQAYKDKNPKIRYIKQDGNKGACAARNLGIKNAKADFIGFLDDDDTWEPTKAENS